MKSTKRRKVFPIPQAHADPATASEVREAGFSLYQHLVSLYALSKLSAKDLCVACHYAANAAVAGGDFVSLAMEPTAPSGHFQRQVSKVLPSPGPLCWISIPMMHRDTGRIQTLVPMRPAHEALAAEVIANPELVSECRKKQWPESYETSPVVLQAEAAGLPKPIPMTFYSDGVRFTSSLGTRSDSILGFWLVNETTSTRHLLATLRSNDLCKCGCRGLCSTGVLTQAIAWSCRAMLYGKRPSTGYDDLPLSGECAIMREEAGEQLPCTGMIAYIKGDWAEVNHVLGLPSVSSKHNSCPYCECSSTDMHSRYRDVSVREWPFQLRSETYYEQACRAAEKVVHISSIADRDRLWAHLGIFKGRHNRGCQIASPIVIDTIELKKGDRLQPQKGLLDYADLASKVPPFDVTLWRASFLKTSCTDAVHFRCPLFCQQLGTNPVRTLAIDSLHSIYYGPIQRLAACILWRTIESNPWDFGGTRAQIRTQSCRRLKADLFAWYDDVGMDASRRLGDLQLPMLGDAPKGHATSHAGGPLKLKAAETGDTLRWAISTIGRHGAAVPDADLLKKSGEAIIAWLGILHGHDRVVSRADLQSLNDAMLRTLLYSQEAGVKFVPKHHAYAHASHRIGFQGNCKFYACWIDESLNQLLRTAAQFAHRANHAVRIFELFMLQGKMGLNKFLTCAAAEDECE